MDIYIELLVKKRKFYSFMDVINGDSSTNESQKMISGSYFNLMNIVEIQHVIQLAYKRFKNTCS